MTNTTYSNVASGDADVDMQIGFVHGDVNYYVAPDSSPDELLRVAVSYLDARLPDQARPLIDKAAALGLATDELRFYRLLALLSGRNLRQLDNEQVNNLEAVCAGIGPLAGDGEWTAGLRALLTLVGFLPGADPSLVDKELSGLPPRQRELIVSHLSVLLEGPVEDEMWRRSVELAATMRLANDRQERIWTFFQPPPIPPRPIPIRPASYGARDVLLIVAAVPTFLYAVVSTVRLLIDHGEVAAMLGFLALTTGGAVFLVRDGAQWHFCRRQVRTRELERVPRQRHHEPPQEGFARNVDVLFDRYFNRYVPRATDRAIWVEQTMGIRQRLRDELVENYREQRVEAKRLAWLVRYLVSDVRQKWERNTLFAYREEFRAPWRVKARCLGGSAALLLGGVLAIATAPLAGTLWTLLGGGAAILGVRAGFRLDTERRRVAADTAEQMVALQGRQDAYARWLNKLSVKPTDPEMAGWLEAERRILVDRAMRHYRLKASQIIAQAVIETPLSGARRARVKHGPWRYSAYQMVLFLLTEDGVRQVTVHLNFEKAEAREAQRLNYSFQAMASAHIDGIGTPRQVFALTLVNGPPIAMAVTETPEAVDYDEDPRTLSQVALDAAGMPHTLHVMEGVAAEGKEWVHHQRRRTGKRLTNLAGAIHTLLGEPPATEG